MAETQKKERCMSTIVRITVLSWSAALLTASYAGLLSKMDPTFIATVFTAAAATFGVDTLKKGDKEDEQRPSRQPEFASVEPTPEPSADLTVADTSNTSCPNCDSGDTSTDNSVPVGRV
jgi:Domain of unknown function (DUF6450)